MKTSDVAKRTALIAAAAAVACSGALAACSSEKKDEKPASTAPAVAPTEKKNLGSFAPSVKAPAAPTAIPGDN